MRAHIGGLHCSLCTGTVKRALGRKPSVFKVSVSLTHEQALVEFDPERTKTDELMHTLADIGYTLSDPRKVEPFEVQERALARERNRFLGALGLALALSAPLVLAALCRHDAAWIDCRLVGAPAPLDWRGAGLPRPVVDRFRADRTPAGAGMKSKLARTFKATRELRVSGWPVRALIALQLLFAACATSVLIYRAAGRAPGIIHFGWLSYRAWNISLGGFTAHAQHNQ